MAEEYLNYVELLENTLASFYKRLQENSEFDAIKSVLEFMETHSKAHADVINEFKEKFRRPKLDHTVLLEYQNNITNDVEKKIAKLSALVDVLDVLADSEGGLGNLYYMYSDYLYQLSDHYKNVGDTINKLAQDEFNHKEILLNDKKRLEKKE